jgi:hypothetical protein
MYLISQPPKKGKNKNKNQFAIANFATPKPLTFCNPKPPKPP